MELQTQKPNTRRPVKTVVPHGSYSSDSPYEIVQHRYAGGRHGFVEALEIKDAPPDKPAFVVYLYDHQGDAYRRWIFVWESIEAANVGFDRIFGGMIRFTNLADKLAQIPGYREMVALGRDDVVWFYQVDAAD